jgi:hypothetical protein
MKDVYRMEERGGGKFARPRVVSRRFGRVRVVQIT